MAGQVPTVEEHFSTPFEQLPYFAPVDQGYPKNDHKNYPIHSPALGRGF